MLRIELWTSQSEGEEETQLGIFNLKFNSKSKMQCWPKMLKIELCTSQSEGKETQLGTRVGAFLPAGSRTCTSRRGEEKGKQRRGSNIFGLFPFQAEPIPLGGIWRERKELENKTREGEKDMGGTSGMCCFPLPPGTGEPWGGEDGEMGGSSQFGTKMKGTHLLRWPLVMKLVTLGLRLHLKMWEEDLKVWDFEDFLWGEGE